MPVVIGDVRFRRALMEATNRDLIAASVGGVNPTDSYLDITDPDYPAVADSVVHYDYDVTQATQLLDLIGLAKGPDGFYQDADGQRLTVESRTPAAFDIGVKVQSLIAADWRTVGVDVTEVAIRRSRRRTRSTVAPFRGSRWSTRPVGCWA